MKINLKVIILFFYITFAHDVLSNEINFEASKMDVKKNGDEIYAYNSKANIKSDNIEVISKNTIYYKKRGKVIFSNDVYFLDKDSQINITSDQIDYDMIINLIHSKDNTTINIKDKYLINSKSIYYDRNNKKIYSDQNTIIQDIDKNIYKLKKNFNFDIEKEIIKSNEALIIDKDNNKYLFEDLVINLKTNEIAGNEIRVEFEKSYFGNENNEPLLKGRSAYSDEKELKVYKGVFSTCNIKNKKCRGWELNAKEFKHDKEKKLFQYKESWLKIFNYKIFYLPYFSHPDPSVKRKSGFLTPSYTTSESFGTSANIPYFKVLGIDKDITFKSRYYADKSFMLQNEYRQELENSSILSDFGFLIGNAGTKSHFFYNQIGKINHSTNYTLNLQGVNGDNYLKNHKLKETSSLIEDDNLLLSNLDLNWDFTDAKLNTSFKIFEDLSRNNNDRFQYVFPSFSFERNIEIPRKYDGQFDFRSYGYHKNYDTNIKVVSIINDFIFSSNEYVNSRGLTTNYDLLLKNSNEYNNNNINEDADYELFGTIKVDTSLPLIKEMEYFTHYLKPIVSLRYSPNGNTDLSSKDIMLNYERVFDLDRISSGSEVEGGEAMSLGLEFKRDNKQGFNILDFKVANVLRLSENYRLPNKSKLNKTRSDIVGSLNYNMNNYLGFGYYFSYDRDLKYSNLDQFNLNLNLNNFISNFYFYSENNDLEDKESIKNRTTYKLNKENQFVFEINKDLEKDFTQYYDLIYNYQTDCISINFNYNKSFFSDGNLEPNKTLSFLIKIIPFTEIGVPNIDSLVKR